MLDVEYIFAELHAVACERLGDEFYVDFSLGSPEEFPETRNMAYTARNKRGDLCIVVAPKLVVCDDEERVQGVLRHEFGHAVLWHMGKMNHSEREADTMGEDLFGEPIYYDAETVQTLASGTRPRPHHLPK